MDDIIFTILYHFVSCYRVYIDREARQHIR